MKDVVDVEVGSGYELILVFEGDERRKIDIEARVPLEGIFAPLRDLDYFRRVRVNSDVGTIVWPNGADLCPDVLYDDSEPLAPEQSLPHGT